MIQDVLIAMQMQPDAPLREVEQQMAVDTSLLKDVMQLQEVMLDEMLQMLDVGQNINLSA